MVIKDLNEIKNKDITKMSDVELANFRADVKDTLTDSDKTAKTKLFHRINSIVNYIGWFGIVAAAFGIIYPWLAHGTPGFSVKNILIGVASVVPMIVTSILERIAKNKCKIIRETCNDRIAEIDKQVATQKVIESLKQSDIQNILKNNEQVAVKTTEQEKAE